MPRKIVSHNKGERIGSTTIRGKIHVAAWSPIRNRQYEDILQSLLERGRNEADARRIAAATVNKFRATHGETTTSKKAL